MIEQILLTYTTRCILVQLGEYSFWSQGLKGLCLVDFITGKKLGKLWKLQLYEQIEVLWTLASQTVSFGFKIQGWEMEAAGKVNSQVATLQEKVKNRCIMYLPWPVKLSQL